MTTLVLNSVMAVGKNIGQNLVKTTGRFAVSYAKQAIGRAFDNRVFEGPRLDILHIQSSRDGAPMPRIFGKARIAGQVIWAAKVKEIAKEESVGGKGGGPRSRQYSYTLSFAIGLCEGEVLSVERIWANGKILKLKDLNMRLYKGTQTQMPDPLIAEIEGGDIPAFRRTAYMVFEDMPIDDFGGRMPQFNFEVIRMPPRTNDELRLEELIAGVDLIPGSGEFAYSTNTIEERRGPGASKPLNINNFSGKADMDAALDQLGQQLPNCKSVTLVVSWFGDDLRAGHCQLRPGIESTARQIYENDWQVGGVSRAQGYPISKIKGRPVYGGSPSDKSVIEAVQGLKARGYKVSLYPFILMDVPEDNNLPNPYGGIGQAVFPWRGRITCYPAPGVSGSADKTAQAVSQIENFFGTCNPSDFTSSGASISYSGPSENSFRRMILHYAKLTQAAGGVDTFIIGSEMRGLTTVRGVGNTFPAVNAFKNLAADVRSILGVNTKLTYAADWSEYFGYHPADGSGDVFFHLDPLWADSNIDAVGIDAYFPLSDWREGAEHLDAVIADNIYNLDYLSGNMEAGEGYDWYYANAFDRDTQTRSPITDGLASKPWVFRYKDVKSWWANPHYNRSNGKEVPQATEWQVQSKPIWFTEIGCPAIDKGANQPNVFWDPKSSESYAPYYSRGGRDDLIQRRYLEAFISYWDEGANHNPISTIYGAPMVDMSNAHVWCWDARPFPDFPARKDIWSDGDNWRTGHWVSGRTGLVSLADIVSDITVSSGSAAPDVNSLFGMVSGYVIDHPMSARTALTPLSLAYGFDMSEQGENLSFITRGALAPLLLDTQSLALEDDEALLSIRRKDSQERLKDVRLSYIDQGHDYQSGSIYARDKLAETVHILDISAPLVLDAGQAKLMAETILQRSLDESARLQFNLPPSHLYLQAGDSIKLPGQDGVWQITDLDGLGHRGASARRIGADFNFFQNGPDTDRAGEISWPARPDGFVLDIADFSGSGARQGPLVGAVQNPFINVLAQGPNGQETDLENPVFIGALMESLRPGRCGIYTQARCQIYMPGAKLSSLTDKDFLAGGNLLAIERGIEWEILQFRDAVLIGLDTYKISMFLRGQYGTGHEDSIQAGARIALLRSGWQDLPVAADLRSSDITVSLVASGRSDTQTTNSFYEAKHLRPLSPVHIKTKKTDTSLEISWIRRTRIGGDDWASLEVPLGEAIELYEVDIFLGDTLISPHQINTASLSVALSKLPNGALSLAVYQISQIYGRGRAGKHAFTL
ncbi:MAG: glycoside hydrolase/phage tail family protein [Robiginitomaculum sp.]